MISFSFNYIVVIIVCIAFESSYFTWLNQETSFYYTSLVTAIESWSEVLFSGRLQPYLQIEG